MNFLAHLYLSGDDPKLMVGNFIGDFVKGKNALESFEPDIIRGIELHRGIDAFTDKHPIVAESKNRLREKYRHYSGVIVDVFYDHFLAKNWSNYHHQPLLDFSLHAYRTIDSFDSILPSDVKHMLPYMKRGNWLVGYAFVEGIHRSLSGMASRTTFISNMEQASSELVTYYDDFQKEFQEFFPQLNAYCVNKIQEWNQART
ncbi:MAG TPA: ACP phosphodiesterase [Chryseosolibacter sp.]